MNKLFAGFQHLEKLKISNADFALAELGVFSQMQCLKSLDLRQCCLSYYSVQTLLNALCMNKNSIAELDLRQNFMLRDRKEYQTSEPRENLKALLLLFYKVLLKSNSCCQLLFLDEGVGFNRSYGDLDLKKIISTWPKLVFDFECDPIYKLIQQQLKINQNMHNKLHIQSLHNTIINLRNLIYSLENVKKQSSENPLLDEQLATKNQELSKKAQELSEICNKLRNENCFDANYYTGKALEATGEYQEAFTLYMEIPSDHIHFDEARHDAMQIILDENIPIKCIPHELLPDDSSSPKLQRLYVAIKLGLEASFSGGSKCTEVIAKYIDEYHRGDGIREVDMQLIEALKNPKNTIMYLLMQLQQVTLQLRNANSAAPAAMPAAPAPITWLAPQSTADSPEATPKATSSGGSNRAEIHKPDETAEVHDHESEEATTKPQQRVA